MKQRVYDKDKIEGLTKQYIKSGDDNIFVELMKELEPVIKIQLGKGYSSLKEHWNDMSQEVLLKLWKNKEGLKTASSTSLFFFFYGCIRRDLFRAAKLMKRLYLSEEQFPEYKESDSN